MGKKDKEKKEKSKKDDLIKAIGVVNSFGIDVVYRGGGGNAFGKKAVIDHLYPKSIRQQLLERRDDIDRQLDQLNAS